jgi:hypothetical protein
MAQSEFSPDLPVKSLIHRKKKAFHRLIVSSSDTGLILASFINHYEYIEAGSIGSYRTEYLLRKFSSC